MKTSLYQKLFAVDNRYYVEVETLEDLMKVIEQGGGAIIYPPRDGVKDDSPYKDWFMWISNDGFKQK